MTKIAISISIAIITAFIIAATGWNFSAVASFPDKYVPKSENREDHRRIEQKIDRLMELILKLHTQTSSDKEKDNE